MTLNQLLTRLAAKILGVAAAERGTYVMTTTGGVVTVKYELPRPLSAREALDLFTSAGVAVDTVKAGPVVAGSRRCFMGVVPHEGPMPVEAILIFTEA